MNQKYGTGKHIVHLNMIEINEKSLSFMITVYDNFS